MTNTKPTAAQVRYLQSLVEEGAEGRVITLKMERTAAALARMGLAESRVPEGGGWERSYLTEAGRAYLAK